MGLFLEGKEFFWRRRRDSNPRGPFEPNGFQDRRFQPLTHPSAQNPAILEGAGDLLRDYHNSQFSRPHFSAFNS